MGVWGGGEGGRREGGWEGERERVGGRDGGSVGGREEREREREGGMSGGVGRELKSNRDVP